MRISLESRKAILLGALVGDALGVPYEFHAAQALPARELLEMEPPADFKRSHRKVPPGTWSDDGALLLALLDALLVEPRLDMEDFGKRMLKWRHEGAYTPDGVVFDIGIQTSMSLSKLAAGEKAYMSGGDQPHHNGNGSLMRTLACVIAPLPSDPDVTWQELLVSRAMLQGTPTHAHPLSAVCCALASMACAGLALGQAPQEAFRQALQAVESFVEGTRAQAELGLVLGAQHEGSLTGSGFVVESWWSAWWALYSSNSYEECVKNAVALGSDTDTTACIAGGLAGARWGTQGIPERWLHALRGRELALSVLHRVPAGH